MVATGVIPPNAVDKNALHRYLFRRADHFGRLKLNLRAVADDTGLNYCNLSVVVGRMVTEGRLRVIGGNSYGRKTYQVIPPDSWPGA